MPELKKLLYRIFCYDCGNDVDELDSHTVCPDCHGPLDVVYDYVSLASSISRAKLVSSPESMSKYFNFFPLKNNDFALSMQEGRTPLYHMEKIGSELKLSDLWLKNEGANPTGVFKDRGTLVEVIKAVEMKAKAIMVASSGNMAASCAAYAAKAGLSCYVLVPENTPIGKMSQMLSYGAHVIKIRGHYSDCVDIVQKVASEHGFYLAGDYVFRREGQKSLAYELCEEMDFRAPDVVVCPTGAGTHISGLWRGFVEFHKFGLVRNLPRMILVQAAGCSPIVEAFEKKRKKCLQWGEISTVCTAVAVADPSDGEMALEAVAASHGFAISVSDEDVLHAQKWLASTEAVFTEPSSAIGIAALAHLHKNGIIKKDEKIVCIATGNGLKDPLTPLQNLPVPPVLEADHRAVSRYLRSRLDKSISK